MIRNIQRYAKTFCFIALGVAVLWVAYSVHVTSNTLNREVVATASDIHTTLGTFNTTLTSVNGLVGTLSKSINTLNQAIGEARDLIATQKQYQDAQNQKILEVLTQTEGTLNEAQLLIDDIRTNQNNISQATIEAVNKLTPMLENAAKAAEEASKTIGDPNLKKSMENIATASQSAAASMKHVEGTTASLEDSAQKINKKVTEITKPASFIREVVMHGLSWGFGLAANIRQALGN